MRYVRIVVKRLLIIPLSLLVVVTLAFFLVEAMPGDPAATIAGNFASKSVLQDIRAELGLDQPLLVRYGSYLADVVRGDLGDSFSSRQPVEDELLRYLPNTVELVVLGMLFAGIIGVFVGTVGGYFRNRLPDKVSRLIITTVQSVPIFVLGLLLIFVLFFKLRIVPAPVGRLGILEESPPSVTGFLLVDSVLSGSWEIFWSALRHMIMPVLTIATIYLAFFGKVTRSTVGEAMSSPQVEFARACGLRETKVVHYGLLAARTPILTYGAIVFAQVVGSATVVELVFAWPGVSLWGLRGILSLDVPVIQGFVLYAGIATSITFLILDVLVVALDPRISYD